MLSAAASGDSCSTDLFVPLRAGDRRGDRRARRVTGDVGIDDAFIKDVRAKVTPGTSALFLLTSDTVVDKVAEELETTRGHATLIHTNLTNEQEAKLREAFTEDVPAEI